MLDTVTATRIIKKYPNRRLYDTELSRYITLSDVRDLVVSGVDFKVVGANNDEDLTRSILLHVIIEQESGGKPLFTTGSHQRQEPKLPCSRTSVMSPSPATR